MNLKNRMTQIQSYFDSKKYIYKVSKDKPPDISYLSLGDGKGLLNCVVTPLGLPIVTGIYQNSLRLENLVAGMIRLKPTVTDGFLTKTDWNPWGWGLCHADGMQPVVQYTKGAEEFVFWALDMTPSDRYWVEETNVLRTICRCGDLELTTEHFIDAGSELIVQNVAVRNLGSERLKTGIYYYAPLNPAGRWLPGWEKGLETRLYEFPECNSCFCHEETGYVSFISNRNEVWVLGSDRKPQACLCGNKPESIEWILSGGRTRMKKTVENSIVDAVLYFDCDILEPYQASSFSIYLGVFKGTDRNDAIQNLSRLISVSTGADRLKSSVGSWNAWFFRGKVPAAGDTKTGSYIKRLSILLKSMTWENGGMTANPGELSQTYLRDSVWAYYGLCMIGFPKEAKKGILCLEGYTKLYGLKNWVLNDEKANSVIARGFDENTVFPETSLFSMDDPAILVYVIGKIFEQDPDDLEFFRQVWPLIRYCVRLAERDMGRLGTVSQNEGFQDDMIHWRFRRSGSYEKGYKGLECVPWNMIWVMGITFAAKIGRALGFEKEAEHYEELSEGIRRNIEKHFWNEELNAYAYFYDPEEHSGYGNGGPYEEYITVRHGDSGHFIFPKLPLMHGLTAPLWSGYSRNGRALKCLKNVREAYHDLPDTVLGLGDEVMPSMSTEIVRMVHSMLLAGEPDAEKYIKWLIKNTPLAGLPEVFPTNGRAVRCWENGEMLALLHDYFELTCKE